MIEETAAAGTTGRVRFTRAWCADGSPVGKTVRIVGGKIKTDKDGGSHPDRYRVETAAPGAEFAEVVRSLQTHELLVFGVPANGEEQGDIVVDGTDRTANSVALTKNEFKWPDGGGLMLLDFDPKDADDGWRAELPCDEIAVAKALQSVARGLTRDAVCAPSSSSFISGKGVEARGLRGFHLYVPVQDAADIRRAGEALHRRLVAAGFGFAFVNAKGSVKVRSLVDREVWRAERKVFAGGANCRDGLVQERHKRILVTSGGAHRLVDTRTCLPDLSDEEQTRFEAECERLEAEAQPLAARKRTEWIERQAKPRADEIVRRRGVSRDEALNEARAGLERELETQILEGDALIELASGVVVTVDDILASPAEYHNVRCLDPQEPDYRDGAAVGRIHTDGTPNIFSYAHGGATYVLKRSAGAEFGAYDDDDSDEAAQGTTTPAAAPGDAPAPSAASATPPEADGPPWALGRLRVFGVSELRDLPPARWLVDGVIPEAGLVTIYGESGSGKTFATLDLACSLVRGEPWRGLDVAACGVLYVAAEGHRGVVQRVQAYEKHHGVDLKDRPLFLVTEGPDLQKDESDTKTIIRRCRQLAEAGHRIGLVILDTLNRVMGGADENKSDDMGTLIKAVDRIKASTGATVVLVHHSGKDASRGARGHSSLRAAMDAELEVTRKDADRSLRVTKSRDGEDGAVFPFRLEPVRLGIAEGLKTVSSCVVVPVDGGAPRVAPFQPTGAWQKALYHAIHAEMDGLSREDLLARARDRRGVTSTRWREPASEALDALVERGVIREAAGVYSASSVLH